VSSPPGPCIACGDSPRVRFEARGVRIVRSPGCGLCWRVPLPDEAELSALYADGYLERWGLGAPGALERVRALKRASHRPLLRELRRHAPGPRLLDVGCALGFLVELALEEGFDAHGLERNPQAAREAGERLPGRIHEGSLEAGALAGERYDAIALVDVLEHSADPARLLAAARERLAPGGLLAALLPNAASVTARVLGRRWPHYVPEHCYHWTPKSLAVFLAARGFALRALRTGVRKAYSGRYLAAYAARVGVRLPPGVARLGDRPWRLASGEMLALAVACGAAPEAP
jgi:SAM-dependent methyltransferase